MTARWPGRAGGSVEDSGLHARREGGVIPLGPLDPTIIHRARATNADALRVLDGVLDRVPDAGRS